jgi:hypothetical protein
MLLREMWHGNEIVLNGIKLLIEEDDFKLND